jgi:hypothetical protein
MTATPSRREQIIVALLEAITPTTGFGGLAPVGRIYRSRVEAFSRNALPSLVIEMNSDIPSPESAGVTTMPSRLDIRLLLLIDNNQPDSAADPLLVELHDRIMEDLTLGGLSMNIEPGPTTYDQEVNNLAVIETHYIVSYRTLITDLTSA